PPSSGRPALALRPPAQAGPSDRARRESARRRWHSDPRLPSAPALPRRASSVDATPTPPSTSRRRSSGHSAFTTPDSAPPGQADGDTSHPPAPPTPPVGRLHDIAAEPLRVPGRRSRPRGAGTGAPRSGSPRRSTPPAPTTPPAGSPAARRYGPRVQPPTT